VKRRSAGGGGGWATAGASGGRGRRWEDDVVFVLLPVGKKILFNYKNNKQINLSSFL
jgi:hypothetical protein